MGAFSLVACADDEKREEPTLPVELAPDSTSFEITWKPDTVLVSEATIASSLTNPRTTDGVYRFDLAATELSDVMPGQVLVLTGVDLVKVSAVDFEADAIVVTTKPATLLDAVTDAHISWDIGADLAKSIQVDDGSGTLRPLAFPTLRCTPDAPEKCESSFSGSLGNLKADHKMETETDGTVKMTFTIEYPFQDTSVLKVSATSLLRSFRHTGEVVIESGALSRATAVIRDIDLVMDLDAGAVAMGFSDDLFKLPIKLSFPYSLGPIPAYFTVGGSISLNPALSNESGFRARVKFHVNGTTGFTVTGTTITGSGELKHVNGAAPAVSNVSYVSTLDAGFGVLTEFPKVSFGLGIVEVASLEASLAAKQEILMNQTLKLDGLGLITSSCAKVKANLGAFASGTFRLAGVSLSTEKQLFGTVREVFKEGNRGGQSYPEACD